MKNILFSFVLLFSKFSFSQNLVPNWSFEDTVSCPTSYNQMSNAVGWSNYRGTCDYFNSCNTTVVGVPSNIYDYQFARTGNAYAGFAHNNPSASFGRECLGTQLTQPLIIGLKYFVSFYLCRAANNSLGINIATNKIGIRFSTSTYSQANPIPIDNYAQVFTDSIITDTLNWYKIFGSFVADSAYDFASIGNFFSDSSINFISFNSLATIDYYFVDDIKVSTDSDFVNGINKDQTLDLIKVFPNPAHDWIAVQGRDILNLSLYDVLGKLCFSTAVASSPLIRINVTGFSKGLYFLFVQTSKKSIEKKIILN